MLVLIDDKKKLMVFWSAKCGCTTVKHMVYYYKTGGKYVDPPGEVHNIYYGYLEFDVNNPGKYSDYKKIWVIRNPYKRFFSMIKRWGSGDTEKFMATEFNSLYIRDHHFYPQVNKKLFRYIAEYKVKFDDVIEIDNIELLNTIYSYLYPEVPKYKMNKIHVRESHLDYDEIITKYKELVDQKYMVDFDLMRTYGYEF